MVEVIGVVIAAGLLIVESVAHWPKLAVAGGEVSRRIRAVCEMSVADLFWKLNYALLVGGIVALTGWQLTRYVLTPLLGLG